MNSGLEIPVATFCHLITSQPHPQHSRCATSWNFNCVWFVVLTLHGFKVQSTSKTMPEAFGFSLKVLSVLSKQLA